MNKRKGKVKTKGFETKLVQLYNIEEDPTEKKEVSDSHPKLVNIMLTKMADYYVSYPWLPHPSFELKAWVVNNQIQNVQSWVAIVVSYAFLLRDMVNRTSLLI